MRPLTASDILKVWERGEAQSALERALTTLAAACPESTRDELAALSVSQRDAQLLEARELTFGPRLDGCARCGQCQERLMFTLDLTSLRRRASTAQSGAEFEVETGGRKLRFRMPNSRDLEAVAGLEDVAAARRLLAERCAMRAAHDDAEVVELSAGDVARFAGVIDELAPEAEATLDLTCPSCGQREQAVFDIAAFFWTEIVAQARRLLGEVHLLASAYGWRESDILAMSARRRQAYLEMID
jgi:hypothetical protein